MEHQKDYEEDYGIDLYQQAVNELDEIKAQAKNESHNLLLLYAPIAHGLAFSSNKEYQEIATCFLYNLYQVTVFENSLKGVTEKEIYKSTEEEIKAKLESNLIYFGALEVAYEELLNLKLISPLDSIYHAKGANLHLSMRNHEFFETTIIVTENTLFKELCHDKPPTDEFNNLTLKQKDLRYER